MPYLRTQKRNLPAFCVRYSFCAAQKPRADKHQTVRYVSAGDLSTTLLDNLL